MLRLLILSCFTLVLPLRAEIAEVVEMLKFYEGFRSEPYEDIGGVQTIGYGFTTYSGFSGKKVSESRAERLLRKHVEQTRHDLNLELPGLNKCQLDALTSLTFNIGWYAFKRSKLYTAILTGDISGIRVGFMRWSHVKGQRIPGLINRRAGEYNLYISHSPYRWMVVPEYNCNYPQETL